MRVEDANRTEDTSCTPPEVPMSAARDPKVQCGWAGAPRQTSQNKHVCQTATTDHCYALGLPPPPSPTGAAPFRMRGIMCCFSVKWSKKADAVQDPPSAPLPPAGI